MVAILIFGSLVEGTFHIGSDIDFAVLFRDKTLPMKEPVKVYGEIYSEISKKTLMERLTLFIYMKLH